MKKINDLYEVLTPTGWSEFSGIKKTQSEILFMIDFTDGSSIECTESHLLKFPNGEFLEASLVELGDELYGNKIVKNISWKCGQFDVYDLLDVANGNEYYTNDIVSHNCAFVPDLDSIWASSQMTLATGGTCTLLSTPNGAQGLFYRLWQQATEGVVVEGLDKFNPISLPWYLHPERDQKWRDQQDANLGKRMASQECDCSFSTSGHTVIESEILQWYEKEMVREPVETRGIGGDLWIWKYPDYSKDYIVCADPARGDGEDYSTFHVIEVETVEQVAEFKSKVDTQLFGNMLVATATEYNNATLIIDNRNVGWSTVQVVIDSGYKNLYYSFKNDPYLDENIHLRKNYDLKQKQDMVPGYSITVKTRPVLISKLDSYFKEKAPIIYSKRFINELNVFMWVNGKAQAQPGYNDDLVMAFAMGLMIRDTSLKLRMLGIDLAKKALSHTHKPVYNARPQTNHQWEMPIGNRKENLKWLL